MNQDLLENGQMPLVDAKELEDKAIQGVLFNQKLVTGIKQTAAANRKEIKWNRYNYFSLFISLLSFIGVWLAWWHSKILLQFYCTGISLGSFVVGLFLEYPKQPKSSSKLNTSY